MSSLSFRFGKRIDPSTPPFQSNTQSGEGSIRDNDSDTYTAIEAPVDERITLIGFIAGRQVVVLKDDGSNTNVISKSFVDANRDLLYVLPSPANINHSKRNSVEETIEIVIDAEVGIGSHKYRSNWIVSDCRYDILLGMPWHHNAYRRINYETGELKGGTYMLTLHKALSRAIAVSNIGVKKFRFH